MKVKGSWLKGTLISVSVLMVLGLSGIGYAVATGGGQITSGTNAYFNWAASNDDGTLSNVDVYSPIDPGDNGDDPYQGQAPGTATGRRDGYNVADTTASATDATSLSITVNNAYPGYHPTIFFSVKDAQPTPGKINQILIHASPQLNVSVLGIAVGQTIASQAVGRIEITLKDSVQPMQTYYANVTIIMSQSNTNIVIIKLLDSAGNPVQGGMVQYFSGTWKDIGPTDVNGQISIELTSLPSYSFAMDYNYTRLVKPQAIMVNPVVVFQMGKVYSDSGRCVQYYYNSWHTFTQNIEMLPGTYQFRFNDGTPERTYTISAGTLNHIH